MRFQLNTIICSDVAMTGEITLRGEVLPSGGRVYPLLPARDRRRMDLRAAAGPSGWPSEPKRRILTESISIQ